CTRAFERLYPRLRSSRIILRVRACLVSSAPASAPWIGDHRDLAGQRRGHAFTVLFERGVEPIDRIAGRRNHQIENLETAGQLVASPASTAEVESRLGGGLEGPTSRRFIRAHCDRLPGWRREMEVPPPVALGHGRRRVHADLDRLGSL